MRRNRENIADIEHSCHDHYDFTLPPRTRRDTDSVLPQYDIDDLELYAPVPRERKQEKNSPTMGPSQVYPDDEDFVLQEDKDKEQSPCVPIPLFVTGLCGHVAKDPTVSIIVLVGVIGGFFIELAVVTLCCLWFKKKCTSSCCKRLMHEHSIVTA